MRPASRGSGWRRLALVAFAVIAIDQIAKAIVRSEIAFGDSVGFVPGIDFVHVLNEGVAFGFLGDAGGGIVAVFALSVLSLILAWFALDPTRPWAWLAIGLLVGGAVGNLVDRVRAGAVTDFIDLPAWPSFNVADMAITFGAIALVLAAFAQADGEESGSEQRDRDDPAMPGSDSPAEPGG